MDPAWWRLEERDGRVWWRGHDLTTIAREHGTPVYLACADHLDPDIPDLERLQTFRGQFSVCFNYRQRGKRIL